MYTCSTILRKSEKRSFALCMLETGEFNMEDQKEVTALKRHIMQHAIAYLLVLIAAAVITTFEGGRIIGWLGGQTKTMADTATVFSPIDYSEEIKEGKYIRYSDLGKHNSINWGKDEDFLLKMGLEPDREVFMRNIRIKFRSVLDIHVTAGGRYDPGSNRGKFAMVMTRIKINGIESGKDNEVLNGGAQSPIYSSTSCSRILEPGEYYMLVEGIFSGCVKDHDAWMQMKITRGQDVPYGELVKVKQAGYYPVTYGFVKNEMPQIRPGFFFSFIFGKNEA